jgi:hypothetical protein
MFVLAGQICKVLFASYQFEYVLHHILCSNWQIPSKFVHVIYPPIRDSKGVLFLYYLTCNTCSPDHFVGLGCKLCFESSRTTRLSTFHSHTVKGRQVWQAVATGNCTASTAEPASVSSVSASSQQWQRTTAAGWWLAS